MSVIECDHDPKVIGVADGGSGIANILPMIIAGGVCVGFGGGDPSVG